MADYIERVKVVGTVDMNTEEAERKLGQLKEPINVRLDVEDKGNETVKNNLEIIIKFNNYYKF